MTDLASERREFEAWIIEHDGIGNPADWYFMSMINGDGEHEYGRESVERAWQGWLARSAVPVETAFYEDNLREFLRLTD